MSAQMPARSLVIDPRTGLMTREWQLFFISRFGLGSSGSTEQLEAAIEALQAGEMQLQPGLPHFVSEMTGQPVAPTPELADLMQPGAMSCTDEMTFQG